MTQGFTQGSMRSPGPERNDVMATAYRKDPYQWVTQCVWDGRKTKDPYGGPLIFLVLFCNKNDKGPAKGPAEKRRV